MLYYILDRLPFRMDLRISEGKKISKIFTRRQWNNFSASSMSQEKFVAAKTITIFWWPSSQVGLLFTPSTWTRSSDLTIRDDSCSPEDWDHEGLGEKEGGKGGGKGERGKGVGRLKGFGYLGLWFSFYTFFLDLIKPVRFGPVQSV
jgi:hypothetical protein